MNRNDGTPDDSLPLTSEVGSEGGTQADPTHQAATFSGDAEPAAAPERPHAGTMPVADDFSYSMGAAGVPSDRESPADGMIRYPTEPPSPPDATQGRRVTGGRWRGGLVGIAAGTAALLGVARMRRKR